jgi:hypothetical protein
MRKRLKYGLISLAVIASLVTIGLVVLQKKLTSKVENFLSNSLPEHIHVDYQELNLSVLKGSLTIANPKLTVKGQTVDSLTLSNNMASIQILDIGYWDYLVNDKISIGSIQINSPNITYQHNKLIDANDYKALGSKKSGWVVVVKNFKVTDGAISVFKIESGTPLLKLDNFNFNMADVQMDYESSNQKTPISFGDYEVEFKNLFYPLNVYDNLEIQSSTISKVAIDINNLRLYTKHTKEKLSNIISIERDHVDLRVEKLSLKDCEFGFHKDSIFYFKSPKMELETPIFNIYRDKLVADDVSVKSLYSKILRDITFDLDLSGIVLKNGAINYSEKVKPASSAGELSFSNLNATIKNLGNTYKGTEKTTIDVNAVFMKSTPVKVNWYFDVNNVNDHFIFKAEIGKLPAQHLNPFTEPNLKVRFDGELLKTYFTIEGNFHDSNVDLRTDYEDFKVIVLGRHGREKNKFLSTVVNLFIKTSADNAEDGFREGSKTNIERDKTKSVFNFVWLNARAGLLSAMTGNGKK